MEKKNNSKCFKRSVNLFLLLSAFSDIIHGEKTDVTAKKIKASLGQKVTTDVTKKITLSCASMSQPYRKCTLSKHKT